MKYSEDCTELDNEVSSMFDKDRVDVDQLRHDMEDNSLGGYFVGGFGGSLMEASDTRRASDDEVIDMAKRKNISLDMYRR